MGDNMSSQYNPFSLTEKIILITGASSGIGRAAAIECSKMGATLIITGRNKDRLEETLCLLEGEGHRAIVSDLSNSSDLQMLISQLPPIDGCFNNAGITKILPLSFITEPNLKEILQTNTIAPILLVQQLVKQKKIKNGSSIVFTSSVSGTYCSAVASSLYSTSKGAINGFVKGAAIDLAPKKIRVNAVVPGMIETELFKDTAITAEQTEIDKKKYPLGRYGQPEEVAFAVIYLLSDASQWVTGTNLLIDGGYTLL